MVQAYPLNKKNFNGQIIIVGFGSIGKAVLPLLYKHINLQDNKQITIICPDEKNRHIAEKYGVKFITLTLTKENHQLILGKYIGNGKPRGCIINVANEVCSKDLIAFAATNNTHYIDTVVEPWPGFYFNDGLDHASKSNFALRKSLHDLKPILSKTPTAISCCGANPGMVSWFVKAALIQLATDLNYPVEKPNNKDGWARLMQTLGVKGIHIAERDTQRRAMPKQTNEFINTWSIEGFVAEGLQPAELGWGTHEKILPYDAHKHQTSDSPSIYLTTSGGMVQVRTWTPDQGEHIGLLITHNEAISIADYYTVSSGDEVLYRPTCCYAYHPSDATVESVRELFLERNCELQDKISLLDESEIIAGQDQLGVLLYGHEKGALWYGSTLTIDETRSLAPHQNATGLQVSSAILAGLFYILEHPNEGLIETDEVNHEECLETQTPYLGTISHHYTDWKPPQIADEDPWQFSNFRTSS
ncbi:MAG: homospermidine synthase [Patescibacteria group bacterium]|nr:homospermidine synthase [Patescibacteria group bacterium]